MSFGLFSCFQGVELGDLSISRHAQRDTRDASFHVLGFVQP